MLAFRLRDKRPHHRDFQHNILFRLRRLLHDFGCGDAVYVCPLFLDGVVYARAIHQAGLQSGALYWLILARRIWGKIWNRIPPPPLLPIRIRKRVLTIYEAMYKTNSLKPLLEDMSLLQRHIVIPPHTTVTSAKHWYSFTKDGKDICFHSPERIFDESPTLARWLTDLSRGVFEPSREHGFLAPREANRVLRSLVEEVGIDLEITGEGLGAWAAWGNFLERMYGIVQYMIFVWE